MASVYNNISWNILSNSVVYCFTKYCVNQCDMLYWIFLIFHKYYILATPMWPRFWETVQASKTQFARQPWSTKWWLWVKMFWISLRHMSEREELTGDLAGQLQSPFQCRFTFKNCAKLWTETPWIFLCTDFYVVFCLAALISAELFPALIRVSGPPKYTRSTARAKSLSCSSLRSLSPMKASLMPQEEWPLESRISSGRFRIWVSSAAGGELQLLWISWHQPDLFARGFVSMNEKFVFDTMHRKFDWLLED